MDGEALANAVIRHALGLERLGRGHADDAVRLLNGSVDDLTDQIAKRYARIAADGFDRGPATTKRLEDMLVALRTVLHDVYVPMAEGITANLIDIAANEVEFVQRAATAASFSIEARPPSAAYLKTLVTSTPIDGSLLKSWTDELERKNLLRLEQAIRTGLSQGESTDGLIKRIRGTRAANYSDGILDVSRRSAQAFALTANSTVANTARLETFQKIKGVGFVEWSSILDSRTSPICQSRSGEIYPINEPHPKPPAHIRCRSLLLPRRDNKGTRHRQFHDWLKDQPEGTQDHVLGGKQRAQLWRDGKTADKDLYRQDGSFKSLDELRQYDDTIVGKAPVAEPIPAPEPKRFNSPINPDTRGDTIAIRPRKEITKDLNASLTRNAADRRYDPVPEFKGIKPEMFGKASLPTALSDEAASMMHALMPEVDAITDAFGVPRLRAIRSTGSAIMNMGDGTLGINPTYLNAYAEKVGEGGTRGLVAKYEALRAQQDELARRIETIRSEYEASGKGVGAFYADHGKLIRDYHALSKKSFAAKKDVAKAQNTATKPVSTWKPGDDPATRPYIAQDYFADGIDKMRMVLFHETGHQVHQMLAKAGRRRAVGDPPLEKQLSALYFQKFHRIGKGLEEKNRQPSKYATTNWAEWWAENFGLWMMGRRDLVDADIAALIERLLDERR